MARWVKYYLPSYLWALLIFIGSSITVVLPPVAGGMTDQLLHIAEFAVFGFLLARSFKNAQSPIFKREFIILAIIVSLLYGLSDEFHQTFVPNRGFEMLDLLADFIGGILGACIYKIIMIFFI